MKKSELFLKCFIGAVGVYTAKLIVEDTNEILSGVLYRLIQKSTLYNKMQNKIQTTKYESDDRPYSKTVIGFTANKDAQD